MSARLTFEDIKADRTKMLVAGAASLVAVASAVAIVAKLTAKRKVDGAYPPPEYKTGIPLIGGFLSFAHDPLGTVRKARTKLGDVFTVRLLTEKVTFLIGPKGHAAFFAATDEEADQADVYKFMTPIFGEGIVYDAPIDRRRQQMRALGGALKPANLRKYPETIAAETRRYFEEKWGNGPGEADIHHAFADLIIQTGSATLMGPEIRNELFDEMFKLYQDLDKGLQPLSVFFPYAPTEAHAKRDAARKNISTLFGNIIEKRRADPDSASKYNDIVQRLMDFSYSDGTKFTPDNITGMMIATLFAAQHTSNVTATWTMLFLLENARKGGDFLQRAIAEIEATEQNPGDFAQGQGITHEVLAKQPWLYGCVKEAIRMHPPIIFLMRRAQVDMKVDQNTYVPKGHMLMVSNAVAQRLPEVFERPDEYLPERWATWDVSKLPKYSFIGFGAGIHTCMGESFAFLQVRTILSVMLSMYEIEIVSPFPEPDYESMVVMPKGPNMVRFKRRAPKAGGVPKQVASAPKAAKQVEKSTYDASVDDSTREITRAEIAKHNTEDDCWIIVNNKVYEITNFIGIHQGGVNSILRVAGGEATAEVEGPQHPGTVPTLLERYLIGRVKD